MVTVTGRANGEPTIAGLLLPAGDHPADLGTVAQRTYTLAEARALLPEIQERAAEFVDARADLAEVISALDQGGSTPLGGRAEAKALEARIDEILSWFVAQGLEVKSVAPLLIDFWSWINGELAMLCWLEGEPELAWYHRLEHGFAGRRRLPPARAPG